MSQASSPAKKTATPPVPPVDATAALRQGVYWLLIAASTGLMLGRLLAVNSVDKIAAEKSLHDKGQTNRVLQRPFLSSNDRSRWATVRSLVEHGTYQIDAIVQEPNWDTIDMVKHDDDGKAAPLPDQGHLYSSKPPLLATLIAGEYWVIHKITGKTLGTHPYELGRFMLVTINLVPMVIYFVLLMRLCERFGRTDWGRMFVFVSAALGTYLSTFAVTLNNHLPAAVSVLIALVAALQIAYDERREWWLFAIAGLFGAFGAACELPALSFFGLLSVWLLWVAPRQTLIAYLPATLVIGAGFFGTNYLAHRTWFPPYSYRTEAQPGDPEHRSLTQQVKALVGLGGDDTAGENWYRYQFKRGDKVIDSYWSLREKRGAIDQGEPDPAVYALHTLVGHHGIFSLTPVWLLSMVGLGMLCFRRDGPRAAGWIIFTVSAVCIAFYLTRDVDDRNYGGMTSGFRWAFWLAPLWLLAMLPAADWFSQRKWTQAIALVLLCLSTLSVAYPVWNPWTHPWLLNFLLHNGWVGLGIR